MNQTKIIKEFQKTIKRVSKRYKNIIDLFTQLHEQGYNRLQLMIIDSAVKNMPLDNLHNTLLLKQDAYLDMLQVLTLDLDANAKPIKNQ